jgi:hypothetical protein
MANGIIKFSHRENEFVQIIYPRILRWKDGVGFDGKKEKVLTYKEEVGPETQIIPFAEYPIIDLLSIIVVTSKKAASGSVEIEKFNLIFGKSTIIVEMSYAGQEIVQFQGSGVSAAIFSINYNNTEMFRLKIFKNIDGYCFPGSIVIVDDFIGIGAIFEIRATQFLK